MRCLARVKPLDQVVQELDDQARRDGVERGAPTVEVLGELEVAEPGG